MVRLWIEFFNTGGIDALITRPRPVDTDVFLFFLDEMARAVPRKQGVRQILILDNASWHQSARLHWHHFEVKYLPGYSPDFNPIERLWLRLKADWFWDFIARTPQELSDRLCVALQSFVNDPAKTASNCSPEMTSENRASTLW